MSQKTVFIRPAHPKADIADPAHDFHPLPYVETGVEVVYDAYWAAHLLRGDVVEVTAPAAEPEAESATDHE